MKTHIQSVNFKITESLTDYTESRLGKLQLFFDRVIRVDVHLKLLNTNDKENKLAEVKVHVPGDDMVAKKNAKSFEEALDKSAEALERMLKKWKEKKR